MAMIIKKNQHHSKETKSNKRLLKVIEITSVMVLVFVLIICVLFGVDYINYRVGNRSVIFGTLDNYNKNQTLRFGDLNLKVTDVTLKSYPEPSKPARMECSGLSTQGEGGFVSPFGGRYVSPFGDANSPYRKCLNSISDYESLTSHYKAKNELVVKFEYSSISEKPINLSDYKVELIANSPLVDYDSPMTSCSGMPKSMFLKGDVGKKCISKDIKKGYEGPLILSVKKSGKEKIINLEIPKL